jgi:hypothetical protein
MAGRRIRLLELWRDIFPEYEAVSAGGKYRQRFQIAPRANGEPLTLEKLQEHVKYLQERAMQNDPTRVFYLERRVIDGRAYWVLSQRHMRPDGKRRGDVIPIYFSEDLKHIYIPETYWRKKKRLATFILSRTLGKLGVSRAQYIETVGRA